MSLDATTVGAKREIGRPSVEAETFNAMYGDGRVRQTIVQPWQKISGFDGTEASWPREKFQAGLKKLFDEVERMMREEMAAEPVAFRGAKTGSAVWEWEKPFTLKKVQGFNGSEQQGSTVQGSEQQGSTVQGSTVQGSHDRETNGESGGASSERESCRLKAGLRTEEAGLQTNTRTFLWDPVRVVSLRLGISQSKLSHLSRMHSGMSALEMVDWIRAEGLKEKFWTAMHRFVKREWGSAGVMDFNEAEWKKCERVHSFGRGKGGVQIQGSVEGCKVDERLDPYSQKLPGQEAMRANLWKLWTKFKASPEYDREIWAHECGFASWARMRRGCLLKWGLTPQFFEYQIADEIAEYYFVVTTLRDREHLRMDKSLNERHKPSEPFCDEFARYEQLLPAWMAKMKAGFGNALRR